VSKGSCLSEIILNIILFTYDIIPAKSPSAVINAPLGGRAATGISTGDHQQLDSG